jgi:hypothetical protein
MKGIRRFVETELCDLRKVLNAQPKMARAAFAKHIQKIVLTPHGSVYVASGDRNFWDWALTVVPGDRIVTVVFIRSALHFPPESPLRMGVRKPRQLCYVKLADLWRLDPRCERGKI